MKLILETDDGAKIEVTEIESVPPESGVLVLLTNAGIPPGDLKVLSEFFCDRLGKDLVVLPPQVTKVFGLSGSATN